MTLTPMSGWTVIGEELLINCGDRLWVDGSNSTIQRNYTINSFENMAGSLQMDILYRSGWLGQSLLIEILSTDDTKDMKEILVANFSVTSNYLTDHHFRLCQESLEYDFIKRYIFEIPPGLRGNNVIRIYQCPDEVPMKWGLMNLNLTLIGCDLVEGIKSDSEIYSCACGKGFFRKKTEFQFECSKCQDSCEICNDAISCQTCASKTFWNSTSKACEKMQRNISFFCY